MTNNQATQQNKQVELKKLVEFNKKVLPILRMGFEYGKDGYNEMVVAEELLKLFQQREQVVRKKRDRQWYEWLGGSGTMAVYLGVVGMIEATGRDKEGNMYRLMEVNPKDFSKHLNTNSEEKE
jgi:hypothetical protein